MTISPTRKSWKPIATIGVVTTAVVIWALFVRWANVDEPFSVTSWAEIDWLEPYFIGFAIQELVVAMGLLYLLSRTALFRRIVTNHPAEQDTLKLTAVLIGIQLISFLYSAGLSRVIDEPVTMGLFLVLAAGILGGWRVGISVGVFSMMAMSWLSYNSNLEPQELFELPVYFEYYLLKNMDSITVVWAGAMVGLVAERWPRWRHHPGFMTGITAVIVTVVMWLNAYASDYSDFYIERWLPAVTVLGLATAVFILIIRRVQDEESRHHAETAQLELTQTRLTLAQTQLALTQSELRALHAQINPHFFFNTLNTIRYFIRTDPDTARDLLINLSEIFQRALSAGEFVPLRDEIAYVEAYLALEKARLDDRLQIIWTNMAKDAMDTPVPTLILQPIVENAVIHGISRQTDGGTVHIVLNRVENDLLIQVGDDGAGFDAAAVMAAANRENAPSTSSVGATSADSGGEGGMMEENGRSSIGLGNVDERLRLLYGDAYRLQITSTIGEGTRVVFRIPSE